MSTATNRPTQRSDMQAEQLITSIGFEAEEDGSPLMSTNFEASNLAIDETRNTLSNDLGPADPMDPDLRTQTFMRALSHDGEVHVVAALTGSHKTNLLVNIAAGALRSGQIVGIANLDLKPTTIPRRLTAVLGAIPIDSVIPDQVKATLAALDGKLFFKDFSMRGITPGDVVSAVHAMLARGARIVIVDGFERAASQDIRVSLNEVMSGLSALASAHNAVVWISSQIVRAATGSELINLNELSESMGKAERACTVVSMARRTADILTVAITKARYGIAADGQVVRMVVRDTLRMELLPAVPFDITTLKPRTPEAPVYVNTRPEDFPAGDDDDADPDPDEDDRPSLYGMRPDLLKPYHGRKGFVGIGREVFASLMYGERQFEHVGLLVSLYEMAQLAPETRNAPGTTIPVELIRGEVLTSQRILAKAWVLSRKRVLTFLKHAAASGLIRVELIADNGRRHRPEWGGNQGLEPGIGPSKGPPLRRRGMVITCCHYAGNVTVNESIDTNREPA